MQNQSSARPAVRYATTFGAALLLAACGSPEGAPTSEQNNRCDEAILALANHPGTVDFERTGREFDRDGPGGSLRIHRNLSAKNGLGMKVDFTASCTFEDTEPRVTLQQR